MVYGNTVDYTADHARNRDVLVEYLTVDIGAQLHRPTGHAINPVPLTEAERIPSAAGDPRGPADRARGRARGAAPAVALGAAGTRRHAAGRATRGRSVTASCASSTTRGVDVGDPEAVLLALRRADARRARAPAAGRPTWKAGVVAREAARIAQARRGSTAPASCSRCSRSTT